MAHVTTRRWAMLGLPCELLFFILGVRKLKETRPECGSSLSPVRLDYLGKS